MALCEEDIDPDFIAEARCVTVTGTHLSHRANQGGSAQGAETGKRQWCQNSA